ncbi:response regulator [Methylocystis parvus]|uniref:response regulator n=1 Tax=Methylocystis parvus TaxID=134 RepID=UPI0002FD900F|nr:response regulator [Methylocystis parvus]WBK00363.1 response regulator [Methylocystis parvus OBBP]
MSVSDAPHPHTGGASSDATQRPGDPLLGRRVLIVEDDPFITLALEETLSEFGLVIAGTARTVPQAVRLAQTIAFDLALLDVNIGDDRIDPVADIIFARKIPFVFTTGCGRAGLPEAYPEQAIVEKPFYVEEILRTLREELAPFKSD